MANMRKSYLTLLATILCFNIAIGATVKIPQADPKLITTHPIGKSDLTWFEQAFVHGFMSAYKDKTLIVTEAGKLKVWGPKDINKKEQWLLDTAKEEFGNYVFPRKEGHKALIIKYKDQPVGAIFYQVGKDKEQTIYLAQLFISPAYQKQGIATYIIDKVLPRLHPSTKRYEVLARHQNDGALLLYDKLNFNIGDRGLVEKYGYNPLCYIGFYKIVR
jgi:ribosomal protein S18 acetylase RimI-like enzyme